MTEKFYQLTHEEWMRSQCLKPAERDVLFWIKTSDPFGDGIEVMVSEIAIALNRNKGTVSRALKVLAQGGWIDLELVKVRIRVKSCVETTELCKNNKVVCTQLSRPSHNFDGRDTTFEAVTQLSRPSHNNQPPEPTPCKGSEASQTNQTYPDFLKTLSHGTRESFKNFVMKKVMDAPFEIASPEAWNNKHWPEYWAEFERRYPAAAKDPSDDQNSADADVEETINELIARGELENFKFTSKGYLVCWNGCWLEWEAWLGGDRPDLQAYQEKLAKTREMLERLKQNKSNRGGNHADEP